MILSSSGRAPRFANPGTRTWLHPATGPVPLYLDLAQYAAHLVDLMMDGATTEFAARSAVFTSNGDPNVKKAATFGLLEGIQNIVVKQRARQ